MLLEDVHQSEKERDVVICITRDLKEGTWDWIRSLKFPTRCADSLFFCVKEEKQNVLFVSTCICASFALCLFMMHMWITSVWSSLNDRRHNAPWRTDGVGCTSSTRTKNLCLFLFCGFTTWNVSSGLLLQSTSLHWRRLSSLPACSKNINI